MSVCAIDGCGKPVQARDWCPAHYKRFLRHGDPLGGGTPDHLPLVERILTSISVVNDCWIWQRALHHGNRYGLIAVNGLCLMAHRVSYEQFVGSIPDGLELDHLCKNKACVNPGHLEPVTRSENVRRGWPDRRRRAEASRS